MAANLFGRYVWLMDILRRYKRLTFQEINELWQESGLGYGEELPLKTFHNHKKAIKDIFDVYIECDRKDGYRYYIDEPERIEGNNLRSWLISSYATLNQIQADNKLEDRIIFEEIPSGQTWLTCIADAMRRNHVLSITHQGFGKPEPSTFDIEPYFLKVVKRRWYVVARSPYYSERNKEQGVKPSDVYLVYALDRISDIQDTGRTFKMKKNFDVHSYFEGCCGIITSNESSQKIVLRAYNGFADYLRTLPLHESQREIGSDDESTLFEYHLKPTFDFYQLVLAQGDQVEVLEPDPVREEMRNFAQNMLDYYTEKKENKPCKE
ncbi:helix-turn-helix transcriptional regulator [Phocaeicola salanitronis]|uniref:helix-turn-helix transcriptional regulator n=1 Tax=Phocaeicola salanitronis TaxID=376805 RepID=UPI00320AEC1B